MRKLLTIIISLCFLSGAFAQGIERQVISSGGGNGASGSKLLSWTIGETVVTTGTLTGGNPFFQGFQMPTGAVTNFQNVTMTLSPRWNYISSYINTTANMEQIFTDSHLPWTVAGSGISVVVKAADPSETAEQAIPGLFDFNWEPYHGYQVYVSGSTPVSFKFVGNNLTNQTKSFKQGWNMIPMIVEGKNIYTKDFFEAASVNGKAFLIRSIDGNASYYLHGITGNNFIMTVGHAYDVYFLADDPTPVDFSAITSAKSSGSEFVYPQAPWNTPVANIHPHTILASNEALSDVLEYGDVIGAFTTDGYCAGMSAYYGQPVAFLTYSADANYNINGFASGETMNFRVYRPSTNETFNLDVVFDQNYTSNSFTNDGISMIKSVKAVLGIGTYSISDVQVYPNPAVNTLHIDVTGSFSSNATVSIYGLDGRVYMNQPLSSTSEISVSDLSSGIYCVKVVDAGQVIVKKFVKQ